MKKLNVFNLKFCLIILALLVPISVTSIVATFFKDYAYGATNYLNEHVTEVSLTNSNFNSSTTNSINTSPSGWSKILDNANTTSGVINVGANFESYKNSSFHLSVNPNAKSSDNQILMINSKRNSDATNDTREGFESNTLTLETNSFYSFQVAFKSDTNYLENHEYIDQQNTLDRTVNVDSDAYNDAEFGDYVQIRYAGSEYYVKKELSSAGNLQDSYTTNRSFYTDDDYIGYNYDADGDGEGEGVYIYSSINSVTGIVVPSGTTLYDNNSTDADSHTQDETVTIMRDESTSNNFEFLEGDFLLVSIEGRTSYVRKSDVNYIFGANSEYFTSSVNFTPSSSGSNSGSYSVTGARYYALKTTYDSLEQYGNGSIYLKGLVDENGNEIDLSYEKVISKEWTTFRFYVATGDTAQEVSLQLWLGGENFVSTGVVYFDEVIVQRYSQNAFYDYYLRDKDNSFTQTNGANGTSQEIALTKYLDLSQNNSIDVNANLNFEGDIGTNGLGGWAKQGNGSAQVIALGSEDGFKKITGFDYAGSNLSANLVIDEQGNMTIDENSRAMALWANDDYVEVKSKDIDIDTHKMYKVTAYYKISELNGTAYLRIEENENIYKAIPLLNSTNYPLASGSASATSNADNDFTNDYGVLEVYIKGSELYNSSINIVLGLGSSDTSATGCVVFDDITFEEVGYTEFSEAQNNSGTVVILNENTAELTIANGNFNKTQAENGNYPLAPSDWAIESGEGLTFGGVINTKETEYEKYYAEYLANGGAVSDNPYLWANVGNPLASDNTKTYFDNILMLHNYSANYQTLTSPTFELSANSYYKLNFKFKTLSTNENKPTSLNISIYNKDGVLLYEEEGVASENRWQDYTVYFETFTGTENVYIEIDFGTTNDKTTGYAYFDNFALTTLESADFEEVNVSDNNIVDMTDFYMNLPTNNVTDDLRDFESGAYTTSGYDDYKEGGIVNATYFNDDDYFKLSEEDSDKRVFVLKTKSNTTYTIDSVFTFDLTSGNYYTLTFKLKTKFIYQSTSHDKDLSEFSYGGIVGLSGFDYMTNLISSDEYAEYTLHIYATEDTSSTLHLAFNSDDYLTTGTMVIYDINFTEISSDTDNASEGYDSAMDAMNAGGYDINEDRVFATSTSENDSTDNGDDSTTEDTTDGTNDDFTWLLLIASLITGLAIVIAVVGYFMRNVKIKKIETKRKETYDRKGTIHRDTIRKEAEEERTKEASELEATIKKFESELEALEKEHREKVVELRKEDNKEVSKSTEKEFKLFAQKRTVISEKIDVLTHQLENIKSPEYLLSLERKKYLQAENRQKELNKKRKTDSKASKKDDKNAENTKQTDEENK